MTNLCAADVSNSTPPIPVPSIAFWGDPSFYSRMNRRAASLLMLEKLDEPLQPADLVHEAFLRLSVSPGRQERLDQDQYFAVATQVMKRTLVDRARSRKAKKRFHHLRRVELTDDLVNSDQKLAPAVWIWNVIDKCGTSNPRVSRIAHYSFVQEMTCGEIARLLSISSRTVRRDLRLLTTNLRHELRTSNS